MRHLHEYRSYSSKRTKRERLQLILGRLSLGNKTYITIGFRIITITETENMTKNVAKLLASQLIIMMDWFHPSN